MQTKSFTIVQNLFLASLLLISGCKSDSSKAKDSSTLNITATIFPLYDFARATAKEQANIKLLIPPGASIHTYEPSPSDIKTIQNANIFLYIGGENDAWAERILSTLDTSKIKIVRLFNTVKIYEEEIKLGMQEEEKEKGELKIEYDEHIWTSPKNAVLMLDAINDALCEKDSKNCEVYKENSANYISQINESSAELSQVVNAAKRKKIVVADRFPFRYLTEEYGLDYAAAFPGCADQADASVATMAFLIKTVQNNKIPYIYHVELSNKNTALAVAEQTGAKMLLLHSYHNVSKKDFEAGITYLDLLKQNVANLKIGLLEEK